MMHSARSPVRCMTLTLALLATACAADEGADGTSNLSSVARPSEDLVRIWNAYSACSQGCDLPAADAQVLEDFYHFAESSPALSQDSRDIMQILSSEMAAAGHHPSQLANVASTLPSYDDPRLANYFLSGEICALMDSYDGTPPGTFPCEVGASPGSETSPTAYWVEPISKGITIAVAGAVIIGGTTCIINMDACYNAATNAYNNAATQCDNRTQFLDTKCARATYENHWARCKPCGGSHTNVQDYRFCCRNKEN